MNTGQSRTHSILEAIANQIIGYTIAITAQYPIFALFDITVSFTEHLQIGMFFTLVSVARSYVLRRAFNQIHLYVARRSPR